MPPLPLSTLEASRIALIKPSALGDIVHTLPVLRALRHRFPSARISWVINRAYEPILKNHPDLDETLPFDRGASRHGLLGGLRTHANFIRSLRGHDFDLVIDLQGLLRSALITVASGARRRVGLGSSREGARWFYTDCVPVPDADRIHAVDRYWKLAEALGVGDIPKSFILPVDPEARAWAAEAFRSLPRPWLVLGVGSRWLTKRWLPEHFATLAGRALSTFGGSVIFVGAREEAHLSQGVHSRLLGPALDLSGKTTLPQLVAVLERADVVVANDTGPLHIAVALGRPIVAPYTCTQVRLTGPFGRAHQAVETAVWCRGSCRKRCDRMECMAELTPGRLWPVLQEVLQTWHSASRPA